jgi:hypothetical protein
VLRKVTVEGMLHVSRRRLWFVPLSDRAANAPTLSYQWRRVDRVVRVKPNDLLLDIHARASSEPVDGKRRCYGLMLTNIVPYNKSKPKSRSERDKYYRSGVVLCVVVCARERVRIHTFMPIGRDELWRIVSLVWRATDRCAIDAATLPAVRWPLAQARLSLDFGRFFRVFCHHRNNQVSTRSHTLTHTPIIDRPSDETLLARADCLFTTGQLTLAGELLVTASALCFAAPSLRRSIPLACVARIVGRSQQQQSQTRGTVRQLVKLLGDTFTSSM